MTVRRPGQSGLRLRHVAVAAIVVIWSAVAASPAQAARQVRVGTYDYAPLVSVDQSGKPVGLYVDIIEQIAAENDWQLTYVHGSWDENRLWLESGEIDLVLDIAQTPQRAAQYSLNRLPVVQTWSQVFVSRTSTIKTVLDLEGQRVAVNRGDVTYDALVELAREWDVHPEYVITETTDAAFDMLNRGEVAAVASDNVAGVAYRIKYDVVESPILFAPFTTGFGTAKGKNLDLLSAIDRSIEAQADVSSSPLNSAKNKWLGLQPKASERVPVVLIWILAGVAGLAALLVAVTMLLRNEVRRKTRELAAQYEALRVSEERYRLLVEQAPEAIVTLDADSRKFIDANANATRLFGCTQEELLQLGPADFYVSESFDAQAVAESVERHLDRALAGETATVERLVQGRDGSQTPCVVSAVRLPSADRRLVRISYSDISEQKYAEDQIRALNAELEQRVAERTHELEAFTYAVSHDLQAPLRALDGFSHAILEDYGDKLDDEGRHLLDRVRAAAQNMARLIEGLLVLSRLTRQELDPLDLDLSARVQLRCALLAESDPERKVEFVIADDVHVWADPALIDIVLENLLANAWKFTSRKPSATIEFGVDRSGAEQVLFVRDDGAGFDGTFTSRLFAPFQRLHSADDFPGSGIGLATVQRIVSRHGGNVWAQGQVDEGATFFFTLPLIWH